MPRTSVTPVLTLPILGALLLGAPVEAQEATGAPPAGPAQVLLLGTYHFANPGLDLVKAEVADVRTPARQAEIGAVVDALARFRPTKVGVEVRPEGAPTLDSLYAAYRAGGHELDRSEVQQLGFRLAARFDHERLHPIDQAGEFPVDRLMAYASEHDPPFLERMQRRVAAIGEEQTRWQREKTIGQILRLENDPARIAWGHRFYVEPAYLGAGDSWVGADLLARWYERNIRIFATLRRIAGPGDRVLVIIGAGHAAILRDLIAADPGLELMDPLTYLPDEE